MTHLTNLTISFFDVGLFLQEKLTENVIVGLFLQPKILLRLKVKVLGPKRS